MSNKNEKEGNKKEEDNRKEAILINKMYSGSYLSNSNTGHETINFLKADDGSKYIYITPYGDYNNRDYKIKYVLLTGPQINKQYQIIAMVEVEDNDKYQDNDYSYHNLLIKLKGEKKNQKDNLISYNKKLKIHERQAQNLKYGGQYLYDIFKDNKGNDTAIYATFKVNNIYIPKEDIIVRLNDGEKGIYINGKKIDSINLTLGRRGIRYITTEDEKNNKNPLTKLIEDSSLWKDYTPKKETIENSSNIKDNFSFINLINGENNEYAYSSMLAYYFGLSYKEHLIFDEFLNYIIAKHPEEGFNNIKNFNFNNVSQEKVLTMPNNSKKSKKKGVNRKGPRVDIFIEGEDDNKLPFNIIIENKIKSGINGNQLSNYKKFSDSENIKCGFIFVPDYNLGLIENDPKYSNIKNFFHIIKYSEISEFFEKEAKQMIENENAKKYFKEFKSALEIQSQEQGDIENTKFKKLLNLDNSVKTSYQIYIFKLFYNEEDKYDYFVGVSNNFSAHEEEIKKFLNSKYIKQIENITPNMQKLNNIEILENAFRIKESIEGKIKSDLEKAELEKLLDKNI